MHGPVAPAPFKEVPSGWLTLPHGSHRLARRRGAHHWSRFFLFAVAAWATMAWFDGSYIIDPLRREILQQTTLFKALRWTRKIADFSDIRDFYLTPATREGGEWGAHLELLLPSGRNLTLGLGDERPEEAENALQRFAERYQLESMSMAQMAERRAHWLLQGEFFGCLVATVAFLLPVVWGLGGGTVELIFPRIHLQPPDLFDYLWRALVLLSPLFSRWWHIDLAEGTLEDIFRFGPFSWSRPKNLENYELSVRPRPGSGPSPLMRQFTLVLASPEGVEYCLCDFTNQKDAVELCELLQTRRKQA